MKKTISFIVSLVLILALFAGCTVKSPEPSSVPSPQSTQEADTAEKETVRAASLKGPTTMGLVKLLDDAKAGLLDYNVESGIYGAPDEITALIAGGKLDVAAIPANLASVLYNKPGVELQVAAINTMSVLNVVELGDSIHSIADLKGKTIYSTGKGTTPEFALNAILAGNGLDPAKDLTVEFKSEATEIAALLSGESAVEGTIAVLPQPYATTVLMANPNARIALSFDEEWKNAGLEGNLVTGVLVVSRDFAENHSELLKSFLADCESSATWVNENNEAASELIAEAGIVPKSAVALKALPYCGITFKSGSDMKSDLSAYLSVLFKQNPQSVGGTLPDDDFYYGA